jgi:hypothetical protein
MPETFTDNPSFELLPAEDEDLISAADQLEAAEASITDDPFGDDAAAEEPSIPMGRSWAWDPISERYVRQGTAPAEVRGRDALREWIYAALRTAQGVHPLLPDDYGIEDPDDWIGVVDPADALSTFEPRALEALVQHDRIEDLDDLTARFDPSTGTITISDLIVITDEAEAVPLTDIELTPNY